MESERKKEDEATDNLGNDEKETLMEEEEHPGLEKTEQEEPPKEVRAGRYHRVSQSITDRPPSFTVPDYTV